MEKIWGMDSLGFCGSDPFGDPKYETEMKMLYDGTLLS